MCIGYTLFSYRESYQLAFKKTNALIAIEQKEMNSAINKFNQYMHLVESRLSHSIHKKETISRILQERIEPMVGSIFPLIRSLEFIPISNSRVSYTRAGTTLVQADPHKLQSQEGVLYLGDGLFKITKQIYDENHQSLGILIATFSVNHILNKYFTRDEVLIFPINDKAQPSLFSFKVIGLPYLFVINQTPPSFLQFITSAKFQIITSLLFGVSFLVLGISLGLFFSRRMIRNQYAFLRLLKKRLITSQEKYAKISDQLKVLESLSKLKSQATKIQNELFSSIQQRYRQMATQAQSINVLTSKLILEEAGNDNLLKEIHSISQEGTTVLRQLAGGFPMKEKIEEVDIFKSTEKIKDIFYPELIEKQIVFSIKGKLKAPPQVDLVTFEIILHSIFHMVMARLLKNNTFQIDIKDSDPLKITFYDNGYDVEEKLHKVRNTQSSNNILWMDKTKLEEFVRYLGWHISFEKGTKLLNTIILSIPRELNADTLPSNVVNLFEHKPYAQ